MKAYISVDMEGMAGVSHPSTTEPGADGYAGACDLMIGETNAAIEGAVLGGAGEVLVNDTHADKCNLRPAEIDPRARLLQGQKPWSMVSGAGPRGDGEAPAFDVGLLIGYHTRAGHPLGTLAHTYTARTMEVRVNGRPTGEAGLVAAVLGHWGIPVGLVSGDDALGAEIAELLPAAEYVVVKEAVGTNAAASVHPSVARELISDGCRRAVERAATGEFEPLDTPSPVTLEVDLHRGVEADFGGAHPRGGTRRGPHRPLQGTGRPDHVPHVPGHHLSGSNGRRLTDETQDSRRTSGLAHPTATLNREPTA